MEVLLAWTVDDIACRRFADDYLKAVRPVVCRFQELLDAVPDLLGQQLGRRESVLEFGMVVQHRMVVFFMDRTFDFFKINQIIHSINSNQLIIPKRNTPAISVIYDLLQAVTYKKR